METKAVEVKSGTGDTKEVVATFTCGQAASLSEIASIAFETEADSGSFFESTVGEQAQSYTVHCTPSQAEQIVKVINRQVLTDIANRLRVAKQAASPERAARKQLQVLANAKKSKNPQAIATARAEAAKMLQALLAQLDEGEEAATA